MFKKKAHIKPLSSLKKSERRRLADQIITDLGLEIPIEDVEENHAAAATATDIPAETITPPSKTPAGLVSLRGALLPENTQSARFTTTSGPDLRQVGGIMYFGCHPGEGEEQRLLWVQLDQGHTKMMLPTVYTLWHNPGLVPLLHTPAAVVDKIRGGADLMIPGLQNGPPFPPGAKVGALAAVASLESPTVPVAVGICETDIGSLTEVRGAQGVAVRSMHWAGDELWAWSASNREGRPVPAHLEGWWPEQGSDIAEPGDKSAAEGVDEEHCQAPRAGVDETCQDMSKVPDREDAQDTAQEIMTTAEIDNAFIQAFLYGVHHHMKTNKHDADFGFGFPLTQSAVMASLVQPYLPTFTPQQSSSLQIKKSSFKTIKKFIKSLDKALIVRCKDRDTTQVVIVSIDFHHDQILAFEPYQLPTKQEPASSSGGDTDNGGPSSVASASSKDGSLGQKLKRVALFRPNKDIEPLFAAATSAESRGMYTTTEVRSCVSSYIQAEGLVSPKNARMVTLSPLLASSLFTGAVKDDDEVVARGQVARDSLANRVLASCTPFHAILRNDEQLASVKPTPGTVPSIAVTLATRSGNKTVTKISGLEVFHIVPQALADELRKECASSTSVEQKPGSSQKNPVMEVTVQGPQTKALLKALENRGVASAWVDVVDKTKGKKK